MAVVAVAVGVGIGVFVGVGVGVGATVFVGVAVGIGVLVGGTGVLVGGFCWPPPPIVFVAAGELPGEADAEAEGDALAEAFADGEPVAVTAGDLLAAADGEALAVPVRAVVAVFSAPSAGLPPLSSPPESRKKAATAPMITTAPAPMMASVFGGIPVPDALPGPAPVLPSARFAPQLSQKTESSGTWPPQLGQNTAERSFQHLEMHH